RAPAEAAAEEGVVDVDVARIDAAGARGDLDRVLGKLSAHPDVDAVGAPMRGRVQRLHRRVRQMRRLVDSVDDLGGALEGALRIAAINRVDELTIQGGPIIGPEFLAVRGRRRAEVPD